jgi:hypothetical protein
MESEANQMLPGGAEKPSLWRLQQSSRILKEVLHDVLHAVKVCSKSQAFLSAMRDQAKEHKDQIAKTQLAKQALAQEHFQKKAAVNRRAWMSFESMFTSTVASDTKLAMQKANSEAEVQWQIIHSILDE